jgi:hypothetical protein
MGHLRRGNDMRRASWILGSLAAMILAACGPREQGTPEGAETGAGTGTMTDTASMAPSTTPADTATPPADTGMTRDTGTAAPR